MSGTLEGRQFPRAQIKWSVTMQTNQGVINTETHDISVKGAFVRCWNPMGRNEAFTMFINVPFLDRPLSIDAEVVWTSNSNSTTLLRGMGVQFVQISDRDRNLLNSAISRQL